MADKRHVIQDAEGNAITVFVRRDKRLKKSSRWMQQRDGSVLLRVPQRLPSREIGHLLVQVSTQLEKRQKLAARRTDAELQQRARHLNRSCFNGKIEWKAIRWVGNMKQRLGSCTTGGPTDGHIRISEEIKEWPQWVIDYVIAHEMAHRVHTNHSSEFWDYLKAAYPLTERARGFILGMGFARGCDYEEDG